MWWADHLMKERKRNLEKHKIRMRFHKYFDPSCEFQRRDDFKEQIKTFYYILLNSFIRLRIYSNKQINTKS